MRPRKRFGQHFLEPAWAGRIVGLIDPAPQDDFVEIGPGRGAITFDLAARCRHLTAIEIDRDLAERLRRSVPANVTVVTGDFLELPEATVLGQGGPIRFAANLPYNVVSPILRRMLALDRDTRAVVDATLMLQREVADRVASHPGERVWGPLGILVQLQADVARLATVPPGAFRPMPAVHSVLVRLTFRTARIALAQHERFVSLVRTLFTRRRKTLTNAIGPLAAKGGWLGPAVLDRAGIDGRRRPETLELEELAALHRIILASESSGPG